MPKKNQRRIFLKKKKRVLLSSVNFSSKMKKKKNYMCLRTGELTPLLIEHFKLINIYQFQNLKIIEKEIFVRTPTCL